VGRLVGVTPLGASHTHRFSAGREAASSPLRSIGGRGWKCWLWAGMPVELALQF